MKYPYLCPAQAPPERRSLQKKHTPFVACIFNKVNDLLTNLYLFTIICPFYYGFVHYVCVCGGARGGGPRLLMSLLCPASDHIQMQSRIRLFKVTICRNGFRRRLWCSHTHTFAKKALKIHTLTYMSPCSA